MSKIESEATEIQQVRDQILEAKRSGSTHEKIQKLQQLLDKLIQNV